MTCDEAAIIIMLLNLTVAIKQLFVLGFSYLSHQQYSDMVRVILNRWPHLQQELSISQVAMEIYRLRMRTYFKNARKRFPTAIPKVLANRGIFGKRKADDGIGLPVIKRGGMALGRGGGRGVKNYLPSYQDGEYASTRDAHRERFHDQYNQSSAKRDQRIIRKLIDLTFPHRRNLLICEIATIGEMIDLYPLL